MNKKKNLNKIKLIMALVLNKKKNEIKKNSSPDTIEVWDSIKHMNLIIALEEEFKVNFSNKEIGELINLEIINLILNQKIDSKK